MSKRTHSRPDLVALADSSFSDYLVACNVTDSLDRFNATPLQRELFVLARSLENHKAEAANYAGRAAYGIGAGYLDENA
jgi:hypothetical protein